MRTPEDVTNEEHSSFYKSPSLAVKHVSEKRHVESRALLFMPRSHFVSMIVNEGDYAPANDVVVSNAPCTPNGMASACNVLDDSFGVEYSLMASTHLYTGDQVIWDGRPMLA